MMPQFAFQEKTSQIDLSEIEFRLIRDFIHEKFGIYFKDEKRSFMRMKLYPRVITHGLTSFKEYLQLVKWEAGNKQELFKMISLLTNNETYFFREAPQLNIFCDVLLSELRKKKFSRNEKKLKILSAGCSTGEEVYTLAMLTYQAGNFFWGWDVKIIGMDVSERAIDVAQQGIYYDRSFRMTDQEYIKKFFLSTSGSYQAKKNIKSLTSFMSGNILDPLTWQFDQDLDIILCRNVLIYFSEEKLKIAIDNFYKALRRGGCLLLGHSETLIGLFDKFELERFPETIIYRKKD